MFHQFPDKILTDADCNSYTFVEYKGLTFATFYIHNGMYKVFIKQKQTEDKIYWKYIGMSYSTMSGEQAVHFFVNLDIGNNETLLSTILKELVD